jgi:hypothetical protein
MSMPMPLAMMRLIFFARMIVASTLTLVGGVWHYAKLSMPGQMKQVKSFAENPSRAASIAYERIIWKNVCGRV